MDRIQATRLRTGMVIRWKDKLFSVFKTEHRTPGNKRGFVQAKLRNLESGALVDNKFSAEEYVEKAYLDEKKVQFLYAEGDSYTFMDTESFEQYAISAEDLGDAVGYLKENLELKLEFYEGRAISVELPDKVDLKIIETEPGIKGASATNVTKPAKMETGIIVQVPPFIDAGESIRVNTEDGSYVERAK